MKQFACDDFHERVNMARIEYLKQQIARAERLAKAILDRQTAERLQAFAAECHTELSVLTLGRVRRGGAGCVTQASTEHRRPGEGRYVRSMPHVAPPQHEWRHPSAAAC